MRWSPVEEWPETPEKLAFHATKTGDIHEGFGPGQQREQENLFERIRDLAALTRVRHILAIIEKYDRLKQRSAAACPVIHRVPLKRIERAVIDSTF